MRKWLVALLLFLITFATAQAQGEVTAAQDHADAVNSGDAAGGTAMVSDTVNAQVPTMTAETAGGGVTDSAGGTGAATSDPAGQPTEADADQAAPAPAQQTQYTGKEEFQGWVDSQVAAGAQMQLGACSTVENTATCSVSYSSDILREQGHESVMGQLAVTVEGDQITQYDFTAEVASPMPVTLPATGGQMPVEYLAFAVLGLLAILVGLVLSPR